MSGIGGDKEHGGTGGSTEFVHFDEVEDVKVCFGGTIIHPAGCGTINLITRFVFAVTKCY